MFSATEEPESTLKRLSFDEVGRQLGGLQPADDVDVAGLQGRGHRAGIPDEAVGHLVEIGQLRIPVLLVAGHLHPVPAVPGHELERPGPDRLGRGVFVALHRQHDRIPLGHVDDEQGVRILQGQLQGGLVRRFDFFNDAEELGVGVLGAFGRAALEVPLGHRGVEGLAVVERDALAQLEGVDLAVGRDVPLEGQTRDVFAGPVDLDQAFENVGVDHAVDGRRGARGRVEPRRFVRDTDGEVSALFGRLARRPGRRRHQRNHQTE